MVIERLSALAALVAKRAAFLTVATLSLWARSSELRNIGETTAVIIETIIKETNASIAEKPWRVWRRQLKLTA